MRLSKSNKDIVKAVFRRHPRPWKVIDLEDGVTVDADGDFIELTDSTEEDALVLATVEAVNRLDPDEIEDVVEPGEVV